MKMVTLKSSDNESFEVEEDVASGSQTIKNMIEDECADSVIPLANVSSNILSKVIEYLKKHMLDKSVGEENLKAFDTEFVNVEKGVLFDLILAANFLNIQSLLNLTCQKVADMIKDKTPEEVREFFTIKNDFTQEEESAVRAEIEWAYE